MSSRRTEIPTVKALKDALGKVLASGRTYPPTTSAAKLVQSWGESLDGYTDQEVLEAFSEWLRRDVDGRWPMAGMIRHLIPDRGSPQTADDREHYRRGRIRDAYEAALEEAEAKGLPAPPRPPECSGPGGIMLRREMRAALLKGQR